MAMSGPIPPGGTLKVFEESHGPIWCNREVQSFGIDDASAWPDNGGNGGRVNFERWTGVGWPAPAFFSEVWFCADEDIARGEGPWLSVGTRGGGEWLPILPYGSGFALDGLFYGGIVFVGMVATNGLRRAARRRGGRCVSCGYLVRDSARCPECGAVAANARP